MSKNLIVKHNKIIEGKYNMTTIEVKIVAKLTSIIKKDDEDFKEHIFKCKDLLEELELGEKNYVLLKESIDKLITRKIEIKQEDNKNLVTTFLSSCIYDASSEESKVILRYDPSLKPYFMQLKSNFTKYYIENILGLNSFYSIRIYELCKQYENIGSRELSLEQIKDILEISTDKGYKLYGNIKLKILSVSEREINEKTDLKISFEEVKVARKVTAIKFFIGKKNKVEFKRENVKQENIINVFDEDDLKKLLSILPKTEPLKVWEKELKEALNNHSFEVLKADIEYCIGKKPENLLGYFKTSITKGHFSTYEKEKLKDKEEERKDTEEKIKKSKEFEEEKEYEKLVEAELIYNSLSSEKLEEYREKYNKKQDLYSKFKIDFKTFVVNNIIIPQMEL